MARKAQPMAADREARLFSAAAEEFIRFGFEKASLNRIIAAAEIPKSSFYHYFTDKQELHDRMMAALLTAVEDFVQPPQLDVLDRENYWPAIAALLGDVTRMAQERPATVELARLFHALPDGVDSSVDELRRAARAWSDAALRRGAELGAVRTDLPRELLADIVFSVLLTLDRWALRTDAAAKAAPEMQLALRSLRRFVEGD